MSEPPFMHSGDVSMVDVDGYVQRIVLNQALLELPPENREIAAREK